eukprot:CAMPEP_0201527246 /NCGR_PEP_ID=MMETSP0161_2-20130828/34547_1 /ASSEMBLY_ACC=CAM_ASM_000251 /TAXON_ID=180227 /ORGANISM="Neoparamoeba aestuarina, Strain SoJaBio B1-5/56/2" /LENGTH=50 /DNA_ID=CAMNT_0047927999 /DNA_START=227 /DNA_END=379 /DNA_ORIENTATION=+
MSLWTKIVYFWSKASHDDDCEEEEPMEIPDAHIPLPLDLLRQMYCRDDDE